MHPITLKKGSVFEFQKLIEDLAGLNYERSPIVVTHGHFTVRGSLIDIFPANQSHPLRIEFEDDKIISIRSFEVNTQTSISQVNETSIQNNDPNNRFMIRSGSDSTGKASHTIISQIKRGDFIVHQNYGIAVFHGLQRQKFGKIEGEYVELEYAGGDRIFTPLEQIKWLHPYGESELNPTLSKLGDGGFDKEKAAAQKAAEDIAGELLEVHKMRNASQGHAFEPDSVWQIDLEKSFPYQETPDQLTAIAAVKADMEKAKPMDRLICGDVGYGKTEIALRAAFKAAEGDKQIAIICPTTLLAEQHYNTFKKRFEPFGHKIEMLSRFRNFKERKTIKADLADGHIDVIIGTHALLQNNIHFKDLGLVIIDEEHRFGVKHKEKLKQLRALVDILTLSATPIPRTLYLSLSGIKDISILQTPPKDRFPIETVVGAYSEELVVSAIVTELNRGGQVFYLFNKVREIEGTAHLLRKLLPKARILVGHGQMNAHQLEKVMLDFLNHEADVLVCSTIIESGLDIPNANTLIVEDADHFGLSQLHQLRGRVGRSNRHAFCYLLYRPEKDLSNDAKKRLEAIQEFGALGSGYQIAVRDLEIRGAGNILGSAQSGHIANIGFELFMKLLDISIKKSRGEVVTADRQFVFAKDKSTFIPSEYVPDERQRLALYRRLLEVESIAELEELNTEMQDRFGAPPPPVHNLLVEIASQLS
jgi:transcription-repair coupling factor (superfamily II helicase)